MKKTLLAAVAALFLAGAPLASAQVVDVVTVGADATPWSTAANPSMTYGLASTETTGPSVVDVAGDTSVSIKLAANSGTISESMRELISYTTGYGNVTESDIYPIGFSGQLLVSTGRYESTEETYGSGVDTVSSGWWSRGVGSYGLTLPSYYIDPTNQGGDIYLDTLIASFADSSGKLIGAPFAPDVSVLFGGYDAVVPTGATELLLGVNSDYFANGAGAWTFDVTLEGGGVGGGVPEAPTYWMAALGALALAGLGARRAWRV
jgi:hypothetical protein